MSVYDALEAFALDKWGTTNPILVPDDEKALQQAYYKACPQETQGPHEVFDPSMSMALARGAGTAAVWNGIRDVIKWLDSPRVRDLPAHRAADMMAEVFERETNEPAR